MLKLLNKRAQFTAVMGMNARSTAAVTCARSIAAVLIAFLAWLPGARFAAPKATGGWKGYHTVIVRADAVSPTRFAALVGGLGAGVVSEGTSPVQYTDFEGMVTCAYADLGKRLDPLDPRFDSFLQGMAGYFTVVQESTEYRRSKESTEYRRSSERAQWRVAYVPATSTGFALFRRLVPLLGFPAHDEWRVVQFDPIEKAISFLAMPGLAAVLSLSGWQMRRRYLGISLTGSVCFTPSVVAGGPAEFAFSLILFFAWFPLMRESPLERPFAKNAVVAKRGSIRRKLARNPRSTAGALYGVTAACGTAVLLFASEFAPGSLANCAAATLSPLAFLAALPLLSDVLQPIRGKRIIFDPIPIVQTRTRETGRPAWSVLFALAAILTVTIFPLFKGTPLPVPVTVRGIRGFSREALVRMNPRSTAGDLKPNPGVSRDMDTRMPLNESAEYRWSNESSDLPDFADFVTHSAYQQSLVFGRPWAFPGPDERVYVREFVADPDSGAIIARQRTVKIFDSAWFGSLTSDPPPGSVEKLLLDQGGPVEVLLRGPAAMVLKNLPVSLLALGVMMAMFGRDLFRGPLIRNALWRLNSAARRNTIR